MYKMKGGKEQTQKNGVESLKIRHACTLIVTSNMQNQGIFTCKECGEVFKYQQTKCNHKKEKH